MDALQRKNLDTQGRQGGGWNDPMIDPILIISCEFLETDCAYCVVYLCVH